MAVLRSRSDFREELLHEVLLVKECDGEAAGVQVIALGEGDQLFSHWAESLGIAQGGLDASVRDQVAGQVGKQGPAVRGGAFKLGGVASMSHRRLPFLFKC